MGPKEGLLELVPLMTLCTEGDGNKGLGRRLQAGSGASPSTLHLCFTAPRGRTWNLGPAAPWSDTPNPHSAKSPPVASPVGSLPLWADWGCREHPGLATQRKGAWQRSPEATLPTGEVDDKFPGKPLQGYGLG